MAPFLGGDEPTPWGRVMALALFHHGGGRDPSSGEQTVYSGHSYALLRCALSDRLPPWTLERLIHCRGIPHSIASDQGNHFTAKEMW